MYFIFLLQDNAPFTPTKCESNEYPSLEHPFFSCLVTLFGLKKNIISFEKKLNFEKKN